MPVANAHRGEVALKLGEGSLVLRCSYGALGKMLPLLLDAAPEVALNRRRWLARSQEQFRAEPPPIELMEWHHHLMGAVAAAEVDTIARCIAILAEEHQPEITAAQVMEESPSWGLVWRALWDATQLFHWRPGEAPEVGKDAGAPFALVRLLAGLSRRQRPTVSPRPNSGH